MHLRTMSWIICLIIGLGEIKRSVARFGFFGNHGLNQCSPRNKCPKGDGDCETDQDCEWGLFCGKNNCRGEFGSHSPQGNRWEGKDDCCTDNRNYCNPADRLPSSRRTCCSPANPCPFSHGDCDKDSDCQSGLICGDNNCKDFHAGASNKDDCCVRPNGGSPYNGGNRHNGGSPHNGGNRHNGGSPYNGGNQNIGGSPYNRPSGWSHNTGGTRPTFGTLTGCEANPGFRCCSRHKPCALGGGDCTRDEDCQGNLVCGSNNCRKFHPNVDRKMDCCAYKKFK